MSENENAAATTSAAPTNAPATTKDPKRIGVGINENVVITNAALNEKKNLVITLKPASKVGGAKKSIFDAMLTAGIQNEGRDGLELQILSFLLPKDKTLEKSIELIFADTTRFKNQLTTILMVFVNADDIKLADMDVQFAGTGITDQETLEKRILSQDVLNKMYENMANHFIQLITPFLNNPDHAVRFKLLRQSKDKHYATIPSRYLDGNPFIESMDIPLAQSNVKFSPYELKEGLDSDAPSTTASAEPKGTAAAASKDSLAKAEASTINPFAD